jgi:hypothetical protein
LTLKLSSGNIKPKEVRLPKKKNGQRALLLDLALEKLLTAIPVSKKSVSASSARVK